MGDEIDEALFCEICDEHFRQNDERAEMYDPQEEDMINYICHARCGLNKGMELA